MLKRLVTLLHRWVGLPLGVLFLVALVSGLIVGGADLFRAVDGKGQTYRETSVEEDARALELMAREMPQMFQALLPTPWTPYYQARARGEAKTYRIGDLEPIDHRASSGEFYRLALGLHRTFLLGRQRGAIGVSGADAVAWVGLIATLLSLLGIWLWWGFRRSFRWRRTVPLRWTRSEMFRSHMTAGVVTVVIVVLLCVTGAAITYRGGRAFGPRREPGQRCRLPGVSLLRGERLGDLAEAGQPADGWGPRRHRVSAEPRRAGPRDGLRLRRDRTGRRRAVPVCDGQRLARDGGEQGLHRSAAIGPGRSGAIRRPSGRAAVVQPDRAVAHRPRRNADVPRRAAGGISDGTDDGNDVLGRLQLPAQASEAPQARRVGRG